MKLVYVGYDLGKQPVTYDLVMWLAELHRRMPANQLSKVVFQPAGKDAKVAEEARVAGINTDDGFRHWTARDFVLTTERKLWRVRNLMVPLAQCGKRVESVDYTEVRIDDIICANWDIQTKAYEKPNCLSAPHVAKDAVSLYFGARPVVTVTIRDSDVQKSRNSDQAQWSRVCSYLSQHGYHPVVIPDTEAVMQGRKQTVWPEEYVPAAMHPWLRVAAYELAQFNLFTSGGPMMTAIFDEHVRYAGFKALAPNEPAADEKWHAITGLSDGHSRGEHRRVWWCEDTEKNVLDRLHDSGYFEMDMKPAECSQLNSFQAVVET